MAYYDGVTGTLQIASRKGSYYSPLRISKNYFTNNWTKYCSKPVEQTTVAQVLGAKNSNATNAVINTLITDMIDIVDNGLDKQVSISRYKPM